MTKRPRILEIGPEDVGGRTRVMVSIRPKTTQDEVAASQVAQALVTAGLISREDAGRLIMKWPHPERIVHNLEMQEAEAASPEIQRIRQAALTAKWKKAHKEMVRLAENPEGEEMVRMPRSEFEQTVRTLAEAMSAKMMGVDVNGVIEQQVMAQQAAAAQGGQAGLPDRQAGGGLAQAALPSQFQMQPAEAIPDPVETMVRKVKRGRPQNNPARPDRQV